MFRVWLEQYILVLRTPNGENFARKFIGEINPQSVFFIIRMFVPARTYAPPPSYLRKNLNRNWKIQNRFSFLHTHIHTHTHKEEGMLIIDEANIF